MSDNNGNPFGLTPDEIDRENGWFRVALAMRKHDSFVEMLQTAGERRAAVAMSEQTKHDEHDRRWFDSGWEACRREVLAVAEHQGVTAAVEWASRHPAGQHEDTKV
jgi:hypothetical protein